MEKTKRLPIAIVSLVLMLSLIMPIFIGLPAFAGNGKVIDGELGDVRLITGAELEIEFSKPVLNNEDAHATFKLFVEDKEVEWDYLSYFDFGDYAAKPVVNVRLKEALEIGQIRARCRESAANAEYDRTENVVGPAAAAKIKVKAGTVEKVPTWYSFYLERSQGYMSRFWTFASRKAGSNGSVLDRPDASLTNFQLQLNVFTNAEKPLYTDEYIARMVGEGTNKFLGRAEYLSLPMIYAGFKSLIVGPTQSVYEAPEYRELYKYGETTDTFTRQMIKATEVPGNFNPATGKYKKPYIVGTSDDIMRHYSPMKADGTPATGNADSARPRSDHFYFGEAFFDIAYELAVVQGSKSYPLTAFNKFDDYRFDLQLQEAYNKAKEAGMWPGTKLMESVKDYYVYGAMAFQEFIPETQKFELKSFPVNTREEVYEYDYPLYWTLSGIHGKWCFWAGKGAGQTSEGASDGSKVNTPWWWRNQPDNYGLPETVDGTEGVHYAPLTIERAEIAASNELHIYFNREVSTISAVMQSANWRIYIDGREVPATVVTARGYLWKGIRLSTSGNANRLDNGNPYGLAFRGFTQADIDERSVSNGGWIADNQAVSATALKPGQYVGLEDAIRDWGAGPSGKIEVAYVGSTEANRVLDWEKNEMVKNEKVEAEFKPWIGHAYRSPLTGFYVYLESAVAENGYYMYRNEGPDFKQPTAKDVAMAAGHQFETVLTNNTTKTYPSSAGGEDFDKAFATGSGTHSGASPAYSWNNGALSFSGQTIKNTAITYDRPGLRLADGFTQRNGGLKIAAGSVIGHHTGLQPGASSMGGSDVGENLRIEGWGGAQFQTEDVGVLRDYNLSRYRNESLVFHEGGHGIDSSLPVYEQDVYNDISAAYATATAYANGVRYFSVDGVQTYIGNRGEYVSTGNTLYNGTMREQFEGIIDNTWTPVSNRNEFFRYDPYGMEAFKRLMFNGDLNLWYNNKVGDPAYRVIPEDWTLLRDLGQTDPAYAFAKNWKSENDLVSWALGVPAIARENPYTGWHNPLVKWVSFSGPAIWNIEPYKEPTRTDWRKDIRFDPVGRTPYFPVAEGEVPSQSQTHPFFDGEGVPMPVRPAETAALVAPVRGKIVEGSLEMISKVLLQFELEDFSGVIDMNNAMTSFDLRVNGQKTHFYFWTFEDIGNNTAKVQLRLEWPQEDPVVRVTVKATGQTVISNAVLKLNLSKGVVEKGQTFTLAPNFSRAIDSNVAVLEYAYNKNLFNYAGFNPADGVEVIETRDTATGVRVTVMVPDYKMENFGVFSFVAKADADLKLETQKIALTIDFVERFGDKKFTKKAIVDTVFATSDGTDPTNPPEGEFTLVTLSNAIDYFGVSKGQPGWEIAQFFDYNASDVIDISDIAHIASKIVA